MTAYFIDIMFGTAIKITIGDQERPHLDKILVMEEVSIL